MERNLAVLIDFENIAAGTEKDGLGRFDVEAVLSRLSDKGRILIARSYADWGRFARFKQTLLMNNVSMMELTSHGMQDKNRADIAMVVEGIELAFTKSYIDTFVIVSGDSDFTPMVLKMRELDKRVIGVGCRSSTSRLLVQACDEFIFYDNLAKRRKGRSKPTAKGKMDLQTAIDLLVDALEGLQRENPTPPLAGIVKSAMLRKSPDFSENELGFSSFARFLERAQKSKKVIVSRDDKSGGYRVDSPGGGSGDGDDRGSASRSGDDDAAWMDPYLPEGTAKYVEALSAEGLNPLAASTRKSVLQAVEESVAERKKRKRRVTAQFVQEDVRRKTRKTAPDLPARGVRHVFNGLMRTGALLHRDGSPVRTASAPFTLEKTAEELNEALADIYVDELHQAKLDLDVELLAELFFDDRSQTRRIEEAMAYLQAHQDDDGDSEELSVDGDDLDALLLADDTGDQATEEASEEPKAKAKPKAKSRSRAKKKDEPAAEAEEETAEEAKPAPKKRTRKKKPTKAELAAAEAAAAESEEPSAAEPSAVDQAAETEAKLKAAAETPVEQSEEASAKPRRRRTRKKPEPAAEEASSDDDMDGLLSAD